MTDDFFFKLNIFLILQHPTKKYRRLCLHMQESENRTQLLCEDISIMLMRWIYVVLNVSPLQFFHGFYASLLKCFLSVERLNRIILFIY